MIYKLVVVDDLESNINIFNTIKSKLKEKKGYDIEITHIKKSSEIKILDEKPFDIVFFDFNLEGGFDASDSNGFEVLQRFRRNNSSAKVILFSSEFPDIYSDKFKYSDLQGLVKFNYVDFIRIVNELNIFRITDRNWSRLLEITEEAIMSLDLLLVALEYIDNEIKNSDLDFSISVKGESHSIKELINSIKLDSNLGRDFKDDIYKMIISNIMEIKYNG